MARLGRSQPFKPKIVRPDLGPVYFDNASNSGLQASVSTYNWTHKVGTNSNRGIIVAVSVFASASPSVSSITVGGLSLTLVRRDTRILGAIEIWQGVAPSTGDQTVTVTMSGVSTSAAAAVSYSNVDQNNFVDAHNGASGSDTPASASVTPVASNVRVFGALSASLTSGSVDGSGQAKRYTLESASGTASGAEKGIIITPASTTIQWSGFGALDRWAVAVVAIKPPATKVSITKSLLYRVRAAVAQTKSLTYDVKRTPAAITKALLYQIKRAVSATKSLQYAVKIPHSATKGLIYRVKKANAATKSLTYDVKSPVAITKQLIYRVKIAVAATKGLIYRVKKAVAVTKGLVYEITTATPHSLTKGLIYAVRKTYAVTKGLIYDVKSPVALTKSLKYTVKTTPSAKTKGLIYRVRNAHAATKSLIYDVKTPIGITKGLIYRVKKALSVTKALTYAIELEQSITKGLVYRVITQPVTVSFTDLASNGGFESQPSYTADTNTNGKWIDGTAGGSASDDTYKWYFSKSGADVHARFATDDAYEGVGSLKAVIGSNSSYFEIRGDATGYFGARGIALTPGLRYRVYAAMKSENVSGDASGGQHVQFLCSKADGSNASQEFSVTGNVKINQGWTLFYVDFTAGPNSYWGHFECRCYGHTGAATLQGTFRFDSCKVILLTNKKSLRYLIRRALSATKSLRYAVKPHVALTKSLQYTVKAAVVATKSLLYRVKKPYSITRSLQYAVRVARLLQKSLTYDIRTATSLTKSLRYAVKLPRQVTSALTYDIRRTAAAITKSLLYRIRRSIPVTKSLRYAVRNARAVQKSLTYVVAERVVLTRGLVYKVRVAHGISLGMQYVILRDPYHRDGSGYSRGSLGRYTRSGRYSRGTDRYSRRDDYSPL